MTADGSWSLATYRLDGETHAGARLEDGTLVACHHLREYRGLIDAVADWEAVTARLEGWTPDGAAAAAGAQLTAPLLYPGKLLCAGANYRTHIQEMGISLDGRPSIEPYLFVLPSASSIIGHGETIHIPASAGARVDWEAELAVVIGKAGRNISRENAPEHVAGYTILNDVSARGLHHRLHALAPPFEWDWLASKGRNTFNPMGPGLVPAWLVGDPHELRIRLWINEDLKQDAPTNDMISDVWALIAYASTVVTLEPGDVIATGTPPGVGSPRGEFLSAGDCVTIEISKIGRLVNPVEEERA
jgi:2-keto-4-pentenoate hydratase/2-oxohepta-3-ene-1,7-dioic acid hydratase in catechol pathway